MEFSVPEDAVGEKARETDEAKDKDEPEKSVRKRDVGVEDVADPMNSRPGRKVLDGRQHYCFLLIFCLHCNKRNICKKSFDMLG